MNKNKSLQDLKWLQNRHPSKGATAYHNAVVNAGWHRNNIHELIRIVKPKVKINNVVIDFGAGTGSSAIYLLKHIQPNITLLLIDNSASWLAKAYDIFRENKNVVFYLLEKKANKYMTLDEVIGKNTVDNIVSANTVHLIPNIKDVFKGIYESLKNRGTFTFQSGNIIQTNKEDGILMIDDSINQIHDLAIEIIHKDNTFSKYKKDLDKRIEKETYQRKFIFPNPRPIDYYLKMLKLVGFKNGIVTRKRIKVKYRDWLNFLRVRRLQAGILPEIGGKDASPQEELDRDSIITKASLQFFKKLKMQNPLASSQSFISEWTYVHAEK